MAARKYGPVVRQFLKYFRINSCECAFCNKHNMSTDPAMETPKSSKKSRKSKDISEKKSSKKRQREEQATDPSEAPLESSPSKKQRTQDSSAPSAQSQSYISYPDTITQEDLDAHSPFVTQTTSLYLPLAPVAHGFPLPGLCAEHISPLLLTYYPPLHGVVLSYKNPRLSSTPTPLPSPLEQSSDTNSKPTHPIVLAKAIDEYATSFVWLTADFTLLRPTRGTLIEGSVRLQNESYLGIVAYNFFNVAIERRRMPKDWTWVSSSGTDGEGGEPAAVDNNGVSLAAVDEEVARADAGAGFFVNGAGVKVDGTVRFRVRDFESAPSTERERGFVSIEGTLLTEEEDRALDQEIREKTRGKTKRKGRVTEAGHAQSEAMDLS